MTSSITFEALGLPGMLADLAVTAGRGREPSDFQAVQLHSSGTHLHGWSTDRYRCAQARCEILGTGITPFRLARGACLEVAKALKGSLRVEVELRLDTLGSVSSVAVAGAVRLEVPALGAVGLSASLIKAMPVELAGTPAVQMFSPDYFADFASIAKRRKETLALSLGERNRVAQVAIGADYRGWVMPLVNCEPSWLPPVWD